MPCGPSREGARRHAAADHGPPVGRLRRRPAAPAVSSTVEIRSGDAERRGLPAAAHAVLARERLVHGLAALLAAVERHLEQRHRQHEQREEGDEDEAGVRDDLVVRGAVGALAAVVREGRGGGDEEGRQRDDEDGRDAAHRPILSDDRSAGSPDQSERQRANGRLVATDCGYLNALHRSSGGRGRSYVPARSGAHGRSARLQPLADPAGGAGRHLSIGEIYAFSVFKVPLKDHFGTGLTPIGIIFSIAIGMLGLSAAFGGRWVERAGPRKAMALAAVCWGSGFIIGALGVAVDQLWIVYLGIGFIGGIGLGIGYISPVSTLIKWFPDRPGMATGLAIMGFGGGALIASPLEAKLLSTFADNPEDALVGSFVVLGCVYFVMMMLGSMAVRVPADDWRPEGWTPRAHRAGSMISGGNVTATNAIKTPQFWLLW